MVLLLLGLLLPTQLGLHLWPAWSYVYGLRVDYLSPTIYLTDLLLVVILFPNLKNLKNIFLTALSSPAKGRNHLVVGGVFVLINIYFSVSPPVAVISWLRILLLINLAFWITDQPFNRLTYLFLGLASGVIITVTLALLQFAGQSSLGGITYWLGERRFDITTPGIARLNLFGHLLLRPYSTFGHPNVLAGFCLLVYFLFSRIYSLRSKLLISLAIPFSVLGIFLSFSKTAIFTIIFLVTCRFLKLKSKTIIFLAIAIFVIFTLLPVVTTSGIFGRSLLDRNFLVQESIIMITKSPFTGVGLGAFTSAQGKLGLGLQGSFIYLQPVHNILLLLLSELGILGLVICFFVIRKLVINQKLEIKNLSFILSAVILTGSLDHYWLTLPQPRLLLAVVLGLILNRHDFYKKHLL